MADPAAPKASRPSRAASQKPRDTAVSTETENKLARAARSAQRLAELSDVPRDDSTLDLFPDEAAQATLQALSIDVRQRTLKGFELPDEVMAVVEAVAGNGGAGALGVQAGAGARSARRATRDAKTDQAVSAAEDALPGAGVADGQVVLEVAHEPVVAALSPVAQEGAAGVAQGRQQHDGDAPHSVASGTADAEGAAAAGNAAGTASVPTAAASGSSGNLDIADDTGDAKTVDPSIAPAIAAASVMRSVAALRQSASDTDAGGAAAAKPGVSPPRFSSTLERRATVSRDTGKVGPVVEEVLSATGANDVASAALAASTAAPVSAVVPGSTVSGRSADAAGSTASGSPAISTASTDTAASATSTVSSASPSSAARHSATASAPPYFPPSSAARASSHGAAQATSRTTPELEHARAAAFADTVDALYGVIADQRRAAVDHSRRMKWMLSIVVCALLMTVAIGVAQTLLLLRLTRNTLFQQQRVEQMLLGQQATLATLMQTRESAAEPAVIGVPAAPAAPAPATAAPAAPRQSADQHAVAKTTHAHKHKPAVRPH
ncbi:hypothetical protein GCM10027093_07560 [Paraburkholderia jirisanensis]